MAKTQNQITSLVSNFNGNLAKIELKTARSGKEYAIGGLIRDRRKLVDGKWQTIRATQPRLDAEGNPVRKADGRVEYELIPGMKFADAAEYFPCVAFGKVAQDLARVPKGSVVNARVRQEFLAPYGNLPARTKLYIQSFTVVTREEMARRHAEKLTGAKAA